MSGFAMPTGDAPGGADRMPDVDPKEVEVRLAFLDLTEDDAGNLMQLWDFLQERAVDNVDRFYMHVGAFAETGKYIRDWKQLERLRTAQQRYCRELLCAPCDADYVRNRLRIGLVHHHIGLEPHWYLASCSKLLTVVMDSLAPMLDADPRFYANAIKSMVKRLSFDIGLAMNAYVHADRQALSESVASLRESQELLSEAHDLAQLARWELLPDGRLNYCARASDMLHLDAAADGNGYERLRRWVHPLDRRDVDAAYRNAIATGATYDVRYRVEHPGHAPRMLRERGRAVKGEQPARVVGTVQDISVQVSQLSRIERLALYDDLTGLPNRAHFHADLERLIAQCAYSETVFSILFIDLDEFKEVNDTKGHSAGDAVLVEVAQRLCANLRQAELVARLGGDEFVVLAQEADSDAAHALATRLADAIGRPMRIGGTTLAIKASIGISTYSRDGLSSELLVRNADTAMYSAKHSRSGIGVYHPDMSARLVRRVQLADRLKQAIRAGTLELYYQPQVAIADGRLVGAEALLRWNDDVLGQVSPEEFVPLAEHRGLIDALGRWVVARACAQLKAWDSQGLSLPGRLAINLSPRHFDDPNFATQLIRAVTQAGLPPDRLDLELTESGIMVEPEVSQAILDELKAAGFSLSLDDFGMGYSSLAHLKGLPLDLIKLDRSFVRGMLEHRNDYAIIVATIAMAQNLGLQLIAEGVERPEQAQALLQLGCRFAQGYHYDMPQPAAAFAARWLAKADRGDGSSPLHSADRE